MCALLHVAGRDNEFEASRGSALLLSVCLCDRVLFDAAAARVHPAPNPQVGVHTLGDSADCGGSGIRLVGLRVGGIHRFER